MDLKELGVPVAFVNIRPPKPDDQRPLVALIYADVMEPGSSKPWPLDEKTGIRYASLLMECSLQKSKVNSHTSTAAAGNDDGDDDGDDEIQVISPPVTR
ncbi:hypothetical protein POX_a01801 [Penicillium oxalicum]|uniref:Uncharacterized protein n=1 Tax=Penicillium oxalicum (strain 114-2 / CGMCC 5302) TaxID=933388 RepID=S8BDU5_PENO1|nr:hypothetical protein POX_a01801 [Penicillium oxalicum]EPS33207.1 hypothetical protein PDE_08169 [Penicillium oxalicum 114-2]KAI2795196.1 hypothetical protein POX_a01801 [Penicillium oxalicum]